MHENGFEFEANLRYYQQAVCLMTSLACSIRIWSTLALLNLCYNVVYEGICFCAISAKLVDSLWLQLQVQVCFQIFITT